MNPFKFECVDLDMQNKTEHYGRFVFNSLDVGTGQTIGTLLRRVLLANLPGLRIVGVKIPGVTNEFSTIQGVREDCLEILLNLKELIFKGKRSDQNFGIINIKGPAIITASCIKLTPNIEVVNPDHYIATITNQLTLQIRMALNWGTGYTLAENRPIEKPSVDTNYFMEIDAVFMPVTTVVFSVETSFSESLGTQERLILDLWTDGSLTPPQAMSFASETIISWFKKVDHSDLPLTIEQKLEEEKTVDLENTKEKQSLGFRLEEEKTVDLEDNKESQMQQFEEETEKKFDFTVSLPIEELNLSTRAYNGLKGAKINIISDILVYSLKDLQKIKHLGKKSIQEIATTLETRYDIFIE